MHEIKCRIEGRVQGVFYRDFAKRLADGLHIVGTVENMGDGSVEVIAQGHPNALKEFVEHLRVGTEYAKVDKVQVTERPMHEAYTNFSVV